MKLEIFVSENLL